MTDSYQKGWALRYLREARAEFTAAQKTPYMAPSLILEAVRKAQAAIYYSFGDPSFVEAIVNEASLSKQPIKDPVLRCLVGIERTVQEVSQISEADMDATIKQVDNLLTVASDIVELIIGEKA